jgi:nucleoside-diphosphate-sugar epimerase
VATGEEIRESFVEQPQGLDDLGENGRQTLFSYLHLADAASIARRAVEESVGGHEPLWAVAADTRTTVESERLAEEFYPHAEREPLEGYEALISTDRAGKLLDWEPEHSWRDLA